MKANHSNLNIKDAKSARKRKFVSPKDSLLVRNESPYLLSTAEKLNSTKTLTLYKGQSPNSTPFRANKYFSKEIDEGEAGREESERERLMAYDSLNQIRRNIESVWNSY